MLALIVLHWANVRSPLIVTLFRPTAERVARPSLVDGLRSALPNALMKAGDVTSDPLISPVAAVSCGIYAGQPVLDLDYPEDSEAGVDGNFIMRGDGQLIEVQMSAEGSTFSRDQMTQLLDLAGAGVADLVAMQLKACE